MSAHSFTKLFSSITDSSIWAEDNETRIVWVTMLSMCDRHGIVSASVLGLANRARVGVPETERALIKFLSPDKYSRTPDHEGRRIKEIKGGWQLLNHEFYRSVMNAEDRKEKNRQYKAESRLREKSQQNVSSGQQMSAMSAHTDTDTDTDANTDRKSLKGGRKKFQKPTLEEVRLCMYGLAMPDQSQKFMDYYESNGWKVGKNSMKCWKATVRMWRNRWKEKGESFTASAALRPSPLQGGVE